MIVKQNSLDIVKIRSSIKKELTRRALFKGTLTAFVGALFLVLGGTFIPLFLLKIFGPPLFLFALLWIGAGLVPYRRLSKLELKPHELFYDGKDLFFVKNGVPLLKVPLDAILELKYVERGELYGAALSLKVERVGEITALKKGVDLSCYIADSKAKFGADLFFPYFTARSIESLEITESFKP